MTAKGKFVKNKKFYKKTYCFKNKKVTALKVYN